MTSGFLILTVLTLALAGFFLGRRRALVKAGGDSRRLHSVGGYHGQSVFLFTAVPALLTMLVWLFVQPIIVESRVISRIDAPGLSDSATFSLVMGDVRRVAGGLDLMVAQGLIGESDLGQLQANESNVRARLADVGVAVGSDVGTDVLEAAKEFRSLSNNGATAMVMLVIAVALAGLLWSRSRISVDFRARNVSENFVLALFIGASFVAVLTTIGIVASLSIETIHFFQIYPAKDFFLSFTWNPQFRGGSDLGIWPLLWGTLYVSFVALIFAVPVGLMSAIYLSEYASNRLRAIVKPLLEILAGIPTIVYGLFALITVGPFLRDMVAQPMGLGASSSSVMTGGLVMGIMLIPFVSSLSDDII
ncbi:MAG: phosphate ABC transporter permease family protein, partial [Albidovulum sp.]